MDYLIPRDPPDYRAEDYLGLPNCGRSHFSLADASLFAAIDMWSAGGAPGVDTPASWADEMDDPAVRSKLEPLRQQLLETLIQAVEVGQMKAEVRAREWPGSKPVTDRSFVHLDDLAAWLELHDLGPNEPILKQLESYGEDDWISACQVAESRANLRRPITESEAESVASLPDEPAYLKAEIRGHLVEIKRLQQENHALTSQGARIAAPTGKSLGTRERRTLLTLLAAACNKAGIKISERGAAAKLHEATAEIGAVVSEDKALQALKEAKDAVETRSK